MVWPSACTFWFLYSDSVFVLLKAARGHTFFNSRCVHLAEDRIQKFSACLPSVWRETLPNINCVPVDLSPLSASHYGSTVDHDIEFYTGFAIIPIFAAGKIQMLTQEWPYIAFLQVVCIFTFACSYCARGSLSRWYLANATTHSAAYKFAVFNNKSYQNFRPFYHKPSRLSDRVRMWHIARDLRHRGIIIRHLVDSRIPGWWLDRFAFVLSFISCYKWMCWSIPYLRNVYPCMVWPVASASS